MLQPLHVSVNKPFKENIKNIYAKWMCKGGQMFMPTTKINLTYRINVPVDREILEYVICGYSRKMFQDVHCKHTG